MQSGQRQCEATRRSGGPCQGWAAPGSRFCFAHDPAKASARAAACRLGGQHRRRGNSDPSLSERMGKRTYRTLADIEALIELGIGIAIACEQSLSQARTLGYLAGQWAKVHEVGEIEQRIAALELQVQNERR